MTPSRDPIRLELLKNAFAAISDEMAATVVRTARSYVIKEAMDFSTGLIDAQGQLISQGLCLPMHMGSFPPTVQTVLERFAGDIQEGDVYITNDPYTGGGTHLPDIYVFKPIHHEGTLLGFAAAIGHQTDIGGRVAGGNACDNTEIFQEGLRIPPVRLFDRGMLDEDLMAILRLNVRLPDKVHGDVMATVSACTRGERAMQALARQYGADVLREEMSHLLDYTERMTRAAFEALNDGEWEFDDYLDDDGFSEDPIRIRCRVQKTGGALKVDFSGSSPQVRGSINLPFSMTQSCTYACVRCIMDAGLPTNSGFMRAIEVVATPGSVVHPTTPAPVAARGLTAMRTTEAIWGALARMLPSKVFACGAQGDFGVTIAGYDSNREPFVLLEFLFGTWGGRPGKDTNDGLSSLAVNYSNSPVEVVEGEQPLRIEAYGFRTDSGGPGKHRGGVGMVRSYRLTGVPDAVLQVRSDRQRFQPYGLQGGHGGAFAANYLSMEGGERSQLPGKFMRTFVRGELYEAVLAGGGGWGDPLERDPHAVCEDVVDGKVSREAALRDYGVCIDAAGQIEPDATLARRRFMRDSRLPAGRPGD
ncbi:Acetophenone carboxylase delta subunit [Variovorax sp. PBS-H4]|uniref:hydantoinase B/oxoprolinase family protein n=1 Tax=Variovorax sp. PBS-H4 TaxID=434008 RepID=UPI0013190E62|nr:hydantoinase B/oxoprolinase family protein [Variovorax sp. PBS-H4]VTU40750.1 Acetophenone carboxylase delta subunit [Variovorax sp. PBS-H4]